MVLAIKRGVLVILLATFLSATSSILSTFSAAKATGSVLERRENGKWTWLSMQTGYGKIVRTTMDPALEPALVPAPLPPEWSRIAKSHTAAKGNLVVYEQLTGWPIPFALASVSVNTQDPLADLNIRSGYDLTGEVSIQDLVNSDLKILGYQPVHARFALNTLIWVLVVVAVQVIVRACKLWRKNRDIRRGRCGNCRYELANINAATCPECGDATSTRIIPDTPTPRPACTR